MKVGVAMSGGIDSSTCLFLLQQQGFEVFGITLRLDDDYDNPINKSKKLCEKFGVEHFVLDCRKEFNDFVVEEFKKSIFAGLTPVPCSICNRFVKFGTMLDFCRSKGAKLATGHYAKIENNKIFRAKDALKDQTHFLSLIKKDVLNDIIFPLGNYLKSEVYRIAEKEKLLDVETYKESQNVCFFNDKTYTEYIKILNIEEEGGDVLHCETQQKLGKHNGLLKYTIGQRQGIGVAWSEPLYVIKRDFKNNVLFVGEEKYLYSSSLKLKNVNFLEDLPNQIDCTVCLRDKTPLVDAEISFFDDKTAEVNLKTPARAITSGQICAFYNGNQLLGGGEIE